MGGPTREWMVAESTTGTWYVVGEHNYSILIGNLLWGSKVTIARKQDPYISYILAIFDLLWTAASRLLRQRCRSITNLPPSPAVYALGIHGGGVEVLHLLANGSMNNPQINKSRSK